MLRQRWALQSEGNLSRYVKCIGLIDCRKPWKGYGRVKYPGGLWSSLTLIELVDRDDFCLRDCLYR